MTGLVQNAWKVWGLKPLSKQYAIRFAEIRSGNKDLVLRAEHIDPIKSLLITDNLDMRAHLRSKEHLLTPALKDIGWTSLECLLKWHAENGHKNILFTDKKFFPTEEQYNNPNNKIYSQMSLVVHSEGAGMLSPFQCHCLVWGVPSGGDVFIFARKGWNWCLSVSRGHATRNCETSEHDALQWSGMVLPVGLSSCPKAKMIQEWLWRNILAFISAEDWSSGSADFNPLDYKLWALLEDGLPKAAQQPAQSDEILCERSARDPHGDVACCNNRVAGASLGLRWGRGRPFWVTLL